MATGGGVGRLYGGGIGGVLLQNQRGSSSMVSFEDVCGGKRSERWFFTTYDQEEIGGDDNFEDYFHQPEKKRRLSIQQVHFLEKSFECENKLEPERKLELAKELGLQPRQVAIWFQNRRARWKTKQLEKDFDTLQASYDSLKADYDNLLKEKEKLRAEAIDLTGRLHMKEKEQELPNTRNELKSLEQQEEPIIDSASDSEKRNPAKSNEVDSESPRYDSCYAFEADHSDISQDDEEDYYLSMSLLLSHPFTKIEDIDHPPSNSCNFELPPGEDHDHASLLWPYWDMNLKM